MQIIRPESGLTAIEGRAPVRSSLRSDSVLTDAMGSQPIDRRYGGWPGSEGGPPGFIQAPFVVNRFTCWLVSTRKSLRRAAGTTDA